MMILCGVLIFLIIVVLIILAVLFGTHLVKMIIETIEELVDHYYDLKDTIQTRRKKK